MYKYNNVDAPKCPGWWWCFPVKESWYPRYPDGLICEIVADDGCFSGEYYPDMEGLFIEVTFGIEHLGFRDLKYSAEVVGKWYGPIDSPLAEVEEN